ncbi:MAG: adenylate/guanylate cyclase domain-containing protein [Nanoarchaeota archaeon]|nr:adenylate/guanylate cyclase domain-containing protein [Nanoarchaeota archaeon]MBU1632106.1 adenylate/guanylate cyclase domain-containing protein [Nanoarchaeota archaeon]MBU1875740.1 adenylate/guanylate cyclase domain-containing protein [Nanoarchaeota archaeon]
MNKEYPDFEVLTIMFIDIVGYTKTTARLSREKFNELHDIFDELSIPVFRNYDGKIIKKIGDAFLVSFKSPTNAVLCGMELQNTFQKYSKGKKSKDELMIRVALHTGEVSIRKNDIYGDAVNIAARLEGIAKAGEIVFSEAVYSAMNKNETQYIHLGLRKLRGLKRPIRIFKVKSHFDEVLRKRAERRRFWKKLKRRVRFLFIKIIFLGIVGFIIWILLKYLVKF